MDRNVPAASDRAAPWLAAVAVAALYIATVSPDFGGVSADTGNYQLGMAGFGPALARPHLPGSWLLIVLLRGLATVFGAHGALLALAVGCSAAAAGLGYRLARDFCGRDTAWLLVALFATQPVTWFHGTVAEIYAFDLCFGVLTVWLGGSRRGLIVLPVVFALGAGLRLTTPALLLPLYMWLWWKGRGWWSRPMVGSIHGVAGLLLVAVFWPTLSAVGGPAAYLALYQEHLTVEWSLARNLWGLSLFLATLAGTTLVLVLAGTRRDTARVGVGTKHRRTLLVWLVPPLVFFVLGHYQKGYILLVMVPLLILLVGRIAPSRRRFVLTALVILQVMWFLGVPYRAPDIDVLAAPRARSLSLPAVWWQRVRSTHLMAATRPRALAAADAELVAILAAAPDDTLLLDPSFPLTLRAMQVRHPERAFAVLEVEREDGWRLHAGRFETTGTGVADLLERCVLVTRRDYAGAELDAAGIVMVHAGERFMGLRVPPQRALVVADRYAELFLRP